MMAYWRHLVVVVVLVVIQWGLLTALPTTPPPPHRHHTPSRTAGVALDTVPPRPTSLSPSSPPQPSPPQPSPPQPSPPPSSLQRPLPRPQRHPCTPTSLEALTDQDTHNTLTFRYRFVVQDPEACEGLPNTKKMSVSSCDNYTLHKRVYDGRAWLPKMNGSVEMCFGGCLKLESGAFTSNEVYLPRVQEEESLQLASKVYLKSSTQLMVPLAEQSWPRWYKGANLKVAVTVGRKIVGEAIVDNQTTLLEVPGNYTSDVTYNIMYKPSLIVDECRVRWWGTLVKEIELELPVIPPPSKTGLVVAGSMVLLLMVVIPGVLVILLLHLRRSLKAASARHWLGLHRSKGDVLLVHAHDSTEVVIASHALSRDITSQCSRKVLDMCCINDPSFVEDPSAWLLKMLTQEEEVTVVLVVTPALTKVANKLKQSQDPEDWDPAGLGPEPDSRDPLIYDCLRSLQEKPTHYHSRLVLVRLPKDRTEESGLLHLTPRRPFLLSQHQDYEHLLAALHADLGAGPPDDAQDTSLGMVLFQGLMYPVNKVEKLIRGIFR